MGDDKSCANDMLCPLVLVSVKSGAFCPTWGECDEAGRARAWKKKMVETAKNRTARTVIMEAATLPPYTCRWLKARINPSRRNATPSAGRIRESHVSRDPPLVKNDATLAKTPSSVRRAPLHRDEFVRGWTDVGAG